MAGHNKAVVAFPIVSALISALCAGLIARDAVAKPRPDKAAWAVAFTLFAVAAASEAIGSLNGWSAALVRIYYLSGAVLVVGYLALGQLYLLAGKRIARFAPGGTLLVTAFAAALVFNAPVDAARLIDDGWEALERNATLTATTITINAGGTLVIVGGLLYSAWSFRRRGIMRNRMIGCLLIAIGTLVVAMGGTATRLGEREYFYVMMSIGVAIIFAGYLRTRQPDGEPFRLRRAPTPVATTMSSDPAIAYIESALLPLDEAVLDLRCREWSIERDELAVLRRDEAIAVWRLRLRLSPAAQERYDALSVPGRRQILLLHEQVLTAEPNEVDAGAWLLRS